MGVEFMKTRDDKLKSDGNLHTLPFSKMADISSAIVKTTFVFLHINTIMALK